MSERGKTSYTETKHGNHCGTFSQTRLARKRMLDEERTDRPMYKISPPCYCETKRLGRSFSVLRKKVHCIPGLPKKKQHGHGLNGESFLLVFYRGCPFSAILIPSQITTKPLFFSSSNFPSRGIEECSMKSIPMFVKILSRDNGNSCSSLPRQEECSMRRDRQSDRTYLPDSSLL